MWKALAALLCGGVVYELHDLSPASIEQFRKAIWCAVGSGLVVHARRYDGDCCFFVYA